AVVQGVQLPMFCIGPVVSDGLAPPGLHNEGLVGFRTTKQPVGAISVTTTTAAHGPRLEVVTAPGGGVATATTTTVGATAYTEGWDTAGQWAVGKDGDGESSVVGGQYVVTARTVRSANVPTPPAPFAGSVRMEVTATKVNPSTGAV